MQLGFVTAILPDLPLADVMAFASDEGFAYVEVMCWPPGKAERRYAGVTHIDVADLSEDDIATIHDLVDQTGVQISALGYYPNCLHPEPAHRAKVIEHLKKVIDAAPRLGLTTVTTFIGRDPQKSIEANWPLFQEVWPGLVEYAEQRDVSIAIENCPMLFSLDEWPGGTNLAYSPAAWRRMFETIPSKSFGLNFDPSHLLWLQIDCVRALREFADRILHVHAKDTKIDPNALYDHGVIGLGWNTPKIPGYGQVEWGAFFSALSDIGYRGPVCIEIEDRAFEDSLGSRKRSLRQAKRFLEQFVL